MSRQNAKDASKNKTATGKSPVSKQGFTAAAKAGKCPDCADRGGWTSFGTPGVWRSVKCSGCGKGG